MGASNSTQIHPLALPSIEGEAMRYVCLIRYQIPGRIVLHGRRKVSPRYETMYGLMYWLNQQKYNCDFTILMTTRDIVLRQGFKKASEKIV
jgi:hypothetical protein